MASVLGSQHLLGRDFDIPENYGKRGDGYNIMATSRGKMLLAPLLAALLIATGCGSQNVEGGSGRSMDKATVNRRVDELINRAVDGMEAQPTLTPFGGGIKPCLDPTDGGSEDRVTLTKNYWLDDVPKESAQELAQHVFRAWKENGHTVDAPPNWEASAPAANLRSVPDDYLMSVVVSKDGSVSVGVTSPCFWD